MGTNQNPQHKILDAGTEHCRLVSDKDKVRQVCWLQHPRLAQYINLQISGNPQKDWLDWFKSEYAPVPFKNGLSIGCGTGQVEREMVIKKIGLAFEGIDINPESIQTARTEAHKNGMSDVLSYRVENVDQLKLPANKYDIIFCSHSLHHVSKLERVLKQIRHSLKSGGVFFINEYVGPSQFIFTDAQLSAMNEYLAELPPSYVNSLKEPGVQKREVIRPTREFMNSVDPSEAVRSDEIVPLMNKYFKIEQQKNYGGTLLQFGVSDIVGNFDPDKIEDQIWLDRLYEKEQSLMRAGKIGSDFTVIVARIPDDYSSIQRFWDGLF